MPYLQRTVELSPEDVDARFQYALCLANAELYDELINQLNLVVEQDPGHADAYYNLGVAYVFEENNEKALTLFKKATEIQPDHFLAGNGIRLLEQEAE